MYGCESWTIKKAEHQRIDAFELWCWRRLLRVPWTARRSNQSILKEISPGISLEGMMLKLKLQYFGHLVQRVDSLEKTDAGRDWGQEEKGTREDEMAGWHHWLDGREWVWVNSGRWWWTGRPGVLRFMGSQRVGHDWATELNWMKESEFFGCYIFWSLWYIQTKSRKLSHAAWPPFSLSLPLIIPLGQTPTYRHSLTGMKFLYLCPFHCVTTSASWANWQNQL